MKQEKNRLSDGKRPRQLTRSESQKQPDSEAKLIHKIIPRPASSVPTKDT
jgi:hypothetical protein